MRRYIFLSFPIRARRRKYAVIAGQVGTGFWHQRDGRLTFDETLLDLDEDLRDYVIVH